MTIRAEWATQSEICYAGASVIPGRSLTRSKAPGRLFPVGDGPLFAEHGEGAYLWDVEGRRYIDMVCGLGAITLGMGRLSLKIGAPLLSLPSRLEGEVGALVLERVAPWASQIRFVKTGSEATHAAYRIAKAVTGRPMVLMGESSYHGWHEWSNAGSMTRGYRETDDWDGEMAGLGVEAQTVAAVFVEPLRFGNLSSRWWHDVRAWCTGAGALLVADEMIFGLRMAMGGASELVGVTPDLACFGKALGNGVPVACVVGREALTEAGELVSGTYSGDLIGLAATREVLRLYHAEQVLETLEARGHQLRAGLTSVMARHPSAIVEGHAQHQRVRFRSREEGQRFAASMATRGVLWHPDVVNLCAAHTAAQIDGVLEAAAESLDQIQS